MKKRTSNRDEISDEHLDRMTVAIRRKLQKSKTRDQYDRRMKHLFDRAMEQHDDLALSVLVAEAFGDPI
jgi:hypothetical protein